MLLVFLYNVLRIVYLHRLIASKHQTDGNNFFSCLALKSRVQANRCGRLDIFRSELHVSSSFGLD